MRIEFSHVIPTPLKESYSRDSFIWNRQFSLDENSNTLILSESGRGKTTFQHILCGVRQDYEGTVFFDGKNIKEFNDSHWTSLRQNTISSLYQGQMLFPELTALENIEIKNNLTHHKTAQEISLMAQQIGVEQYLQNPVKKISFGQRQRIAAIRALCQPFSLLLLDEPFTHLDTNNSDKVASLLEQECIKNGATIIHTALDKDSHFTYKNILEL